MDLALGSLKRVQLPIFFFAACLHVGSHVAGPDTPLGLGVGKDETKFAGRKIQDFLAAFTLLNDGMTITAIKLAAFLAHK